MSLTTVKVSNVSLGATERDIKEFFSFSGDIAHVELKSDMGRSQIAYVTFQDSQGAETAILLSGATIVDKSVSIALAPDYVLLPAATVPLLTTVKVSNVSLGATERDIKEFFSFSGDIAYVELKSDMGRSQIAYVTFQDSQGAETAILLSGATIIDMSVSIALAPDYVLPPAATAPLVVNNRNPSGPESTIWKTEDVMTSMLAKGFILGKDAVSKAKAFDEKHQLTSTASSKVVSFDKKIGLTEKISVGTAVVSDKVREVDQKFQVSEKAKSALTVAEQKVSSAGSAIMKNRYVFSGATWVTGAFNKVTKAAGDVGQKTKEKVGIAEDEQKRKMVDDFAQVHLSESPKADEPNPSKPELVRGLIL